MGIAYNPKTVTDGLVLCLDAANPKSYPGSGTVWTDLSGNGLNGTLVGGVTYSTVNHGLFTFDGVDDHVTLPAGFSSFPIGFTVSCFVNFGDASAWERIIDFGNSSANNNILFARNSTSNTLTFEIYNNTVTYGKCDVANGVLNNAIAHYAATLNGTTCVIYRNGLVLQTFSYPYLPTNVTRNINYIGRSNWSPDAYFQTQIATVSLYNRALSAAEIQQNFQAIRGRYGI